MKKSSVIFISVITTIVTLIVAFIGIDFFRKAKSENNQNELKEQNILENSEIENQIDNKVEQEYIENYEVSGYLKISKLDLDIPILKEATVSSLEVSAGIIYGNGLNEIGNTTITGLNYKGDSFENIHKLEIGDEIIVINQKKQEIVYEVYDKKSVRASDSEYMIRDTNNKREITLHTGDYSDSINNRLIILAKEK